MDAIRDLLARHLDPTIFEYGFADLRGLLPASLDAFPSGISILRKLDDGIVDGIDRGPTRAYLDHYNATNDELNGLVVRIAEDLRRAGWASEPVPATVDDPTLQERYRATLSVPVSHKMVATRSGLGWVGKTDLLVSVRFGTRIRLASVLTTAPVIHGHPIDESRCGACTSCVEACPAQAANGELWNVSRARNDFFDAFACRRYCRRISDEKLGEAISLCGVCVLVCPRGRSRS
jgi:epoxyqueuosine reductase QueG